MKKYIEMRGADCGTIGGNRSSDFDQYPCELMSGVTAYKTPDTVLVGQGLFGPIDMQTVHPLNYDQGVAVVGVRGQHNSLGSAANADAMGNRINASYVGQSEDRSMGFAIGASHADTPIQENQVGLYEPWRAIGDNWRPGVPAGTFYSDGIKALRRTGDLKRDGVMVRLEFPTENWTSTLERENPIHAEFRHAVPPTRERIASHQLQQMQEQIKKDAAKRQQEEVISPVVTQKPATSGLDKPINVDFKGATLSQVCQVLYRTAGLNFIFDKDVVVDQPVSITLRRTPVREVLSLILLSQQLEQRPINADTVMIYPNTPSKARDYQPLTVRSFYLTNIEAKTAAATLRTILKARDLVSDDKQNVVVMRDTPEAIRMAEKLLAVHDMPEPEVMLEVEVLEVKRSRLQELGLLWPSSLMLTPC